MVDKNIVQPKTWSEVYEALFADTYNARINRYKSRFAYRGVSSSSYKLETSLMRLGGEYAKVEPHLLRQFRKYAYKYQSDHENEWFWLSIAQHHGLPTRLMDWTYSPEVALHFATQDPDKFDRDGAIWMVNYKKAHQMLPPSLLGIVQEKNTWILTVDILDDMFLDLAALDEKSSRYDDFVIFFEPPSIDDRIYNQFAYFSLMSKPTIYMDEWLQDKPDLWKKIIIPASLKWEIRDKLDQNNINERTLFPGLDGLTKWLRRYYYPTGSAASDHK